MTTPSGFASTLSCNSHTTQSTKNPLLLDYESVKRLKRSVGIACGPNTAILFVKTTNHTTYTSRLIPYIKEYPAFSILNESTLSMMNVRRTARLQLRRMHALTLTLYPQRGVHYIPPKALIEQGQQEESDFEGLQEEIDDLDDNVCGEDEMFIELSDEQFAKTKTELTQKINQNDSLAKWERTLLLFELDLAQVGWDLRKMQYEDNISTEVQRRIETLLASGRTAPPRFMNTTGDAKSLHSMTSSLRKAKEESKRYLNNSPQKKAHFLRLISGHCAIRFVEEFCLPLDGLWPFTRTPMRPLVNWNEPDSLHTS